MTKHLVGFLAVATLVAPQATAQQQAPPNCSAPDYRQFDFWAGTWDVFNAQGIQVGMNTIEPELNGCVLHESWQSSGASRGNSYNIFDRQSGRWHQSWVDNGGLLLLLDGTFENGKMTLAGTTKDAQGREVLNRITWTPFTADSVQQLWETSADGGATWNTAFDGRYVRRR